MEDLNHSGTCRYSAGSVANSESVVQADGWLKLSLQHNLCSIRYTISQPFTVLQQLGAVGLVGAVIHTGLSSSCIWVQSSWATATQSSLDEHSSRTAPSLWMLHLCFLLDRPKHRRLCGTWAWPRSRDPYNFWHTIEHISKTTWARDFKFGTRLCVWMPSSDCFCRAQLYAIQQQLLR